MIKLGWILSGQATAPSWSLARHFHAPGGGRLRHHLILSSGPAAGQHSAHHHHPHQEEGSSSSSVLALALPVAIHYMYSKHSPGILKVAQVPPPLHSLHLDWGAPAAVYGSATPQWRLHQAILAQWRDRQEVAVCGWAATALVLWQCILLVLPWHLQSLSPMDFNLFYFYHSAFSYLAFYYSPNFPFQLFTVIAF
jgi:hypothetical protein